MPPRVTNPNYEVVRYVDGVTGSSFRNFYPYYLGEHSNKVCRRLHIVGTSLVLLLCAAWLITGQKTLVLAIPFAGYGLAWVGHFVYERNRPATFRHPILSLLGDFQLWAEVVTCQREF